MKPQEFKPTPAMQIYAYKRATLGENVTDKAIATSIGIAPETVSRWKAIDGYENWLTEQVSVFRAPILDQLEMIARSKIDDFRYWQVLAQKYGFYSCDTFKISF